MNGMFEADLFDEIRGMGDLPADAIEIAMLDRYRQQFPRLTATTTLRTGGVTHFTTTPNVAAGSPASLTFRFFDATGAQRGSQVFSVTQTQPSGPVSPAKETTSSLAPLPGDGLLPSETEEELLREGSGAPRWLPWALVGGAVVVGGGIVVAMASRRPVVANRRGRRRRVSRRRAR